MALQTTSWLFFQQLASRKRTVHSVLVAKDNLEKAYAIRVLFLKNIKYYRQGAGHEHWMAQMRSFLDSIWLFCNNHRDQQFMDDQSMMMLMTKMTVIKANQGYVP